MKDTKQIAADCCIEGERLEMMERMLGDTSSGGYTPIEQELAEIIGALYRRIEKLEDDLSTTEETCKNQQAQMIVCGSHLVDAQRQLADAREKLVAYQDQLGAETGGSE